MSHILEVSDLEVQFQVPQGVVKAVDKVSFHVEEGEILGIAGESGCGKSVSCLAIMGLVARPGRVTGGRVMFDGENLLEKNDNELRKIRTAQIAMIFQDPLTFLNPVLTIGDQLQEPLKLHLKMTSRQSRARAAELLSMVGIPSPKECLDAYPHMFSGGMRQRVMIAMALSCNPKLLIADEPTTALDVTVQLQIIELVKKLQKEIKMSVIWITHDMGVLGGISDRLNIMYAGSLTESGSVYEVYANPLHPYSSGLLQSIPRIDKVYSGNLNSIPGTPPSLANPPSGCLFYPRCANRLDKCLKEKPGLTNISETRQAACWNISPGENTGRSEGVPV